MPFNIVSFTIGIWVIAYFHSLPSLRVCVGGCIFLILVGGLGWKNLFQPGYARLFFLNFSFFCLGLTWENYQSQQWLANRLTPQWVGQNILVTGSVISLPIEEKKYTRFLFLTDQFAGKLQHKRLQLSWENPHPPLRVGENWQFSVRLKPPHALVNFSAFNRLRFLWAQDIHAMGYIVSKQKYQRLTESTPRFLIAHWREKLQHEIKQTVHDPTAAAIISALTIGVENGLTETDWQILQRTGTVHLVVIAGLHIGFMVFIASYLGHFLWRCFPPLLLRLPAQKAASIAALVFALAYGTLAGFGIPTQRAVIMIVLLTISQLYYREISLWRRIFLAFWMIIIAQPGALFSAGLWLSFGAVAWITYSMHTEETHSARWRQWLRIQWALFLGLSPLTLYFFQQFSLISIIANLPAIIWIGWLIVPLCLLAAVTSSFSLSVSQWLFSLSASSLMPLWHFLQWLSAWPLAGWHRAFGSAWILMMALFGAAWCLAPRQIPGRWLGLLGFLPIWIIPPAKPPPGAFWLTLMDVGQGLAITVQTAHHFLIYDTGAHVPSGFDTGRDIISPYLITLGIPQIDLLMISHGDNDHSGGAESLLAQWPVHRLLTSIPSLFSKHHAESCAAGQQWEWDGVPFRVLWPPVGDTYQDNNSSCVLQIGVPGQNVLLTGDIEAAAEATLIAQQGQYLQSQILVVPHHGSKTSSTEEFAAKVHPKFVLFSLGYFNRFHFPASTVVARYESLNAQQWFTSQNGAILFAVSPDKPITLKTANSRQYFWQRDS